MTAEEILSYARRQYEMCGENAVCALLMPGKWGKRNTRRLFPGGPVGEIVSDSFDGRGIVVIFGAKEVIDALEKTQLSSGVTNENPSS